MAAKIEIFRRFGDVKKEIEVIQDEEIDKWKTLLLTINAEIPTKSFNSFLIEWVF